MRQSQKHEIAVGIFVLIALAMLFAMTFVIRGSTGVRPYVLYAEFNNVSGLEMGSPVLVQGFRLGRVTDMTAGLGKDGVPKVIVEMKIARKIPIYQDSLAALVQQGFIGDKQVEIDPGTKETGEVKTGETIDSKPLVDMAEVFGEAKGVVEDLGVTLKELREFTTDKDRLGRIDDTINNIQTSSQELQAILKENRENINTTVENVRKTSEKTLEVADKVDGMMTDTDKQIKELTQEVRSAVSEFRESSNKLTTRLDKILADADGVGGDAKELLTTTRGEVETLSTKLQKVSDNLNEILWRVNSGEGTVGKLVTDPKPFEDLRDSVAALRSLLNEQREGFYDRKLEYLPETEAASAQPAGAGDN